MPELKPFKGFLYNSDKVGDLSKVTAPPYDVINPEFQEDLYSRHPDNVVRLILGKTGPKDRPGSDRYSRAAVDLDLWLKQAVLVRDREPAIYPYQQCFEGKDGTEEVRSGFIAAVRLEELGSGSIFPHESTHSGPKADRLSLMKAVNANLSPLFTLYTESVGPGGVKISRRLAEVASGEPVIDVIGDDGVRNRLWRVVDTNVISAVKEALKGEKIFIADGHHRYETALNYRDYMRAANPGHSGEEPYNYVMLYLAGMEDEGLEIFPIHRVVHSLDGFDADAFIERSGEAFNVEVIGFELAGGEVLAREELLKRVAEAPAGLARLGVAIRGRGAYHVLTLKSEAKRDELLGPDVPALYRALDVTVLHSIVLGKYLGITAEAQTKQTNIVYCKDPAKAFELGRSGDNQLVFFMNPTRIEEVRSVSEAGLLMPQKSTYFFPKLLSGLVINPLW